ncbi:hypothetical protein BDQ12DRAFT_665297 [Crucibulum laeve]|uniref:Smr domain-containing protein n=1 Tax=Crucibulum laeve TaxID=68775 RepID=A0A5C3M240_9AGAR|nr:hypothetical protein BDQ12DRAFT_665297 [Crucibulum laeve]
MSTLFDTLQREFCPPLDTSLLAALLADIESDISGKPISPTDASLSELRTTLRELAAQADEEQLDEFADLQLGQKGRFKFKGEVENVGEDGDFDTLTTSSAQDFYLGKPATATTSATSSDTSSHSESGSGSNAHHLFSSPLGFLQAALPDIPINVLEKALADAKKRSTSEDNDEEGEGGEAELDMWDLVCTILSRESIREMEERGLEGLEVEEEVDEDLRLARRLMGEDVDWEIVQPKTKVKAKLPAQQPAHVNGAAKGKRKKPPQTKLAFGDVRQQQLRPQPTRASGDGNGRALPAPDPWTQLSSLSLHLATLLPPHPPSYFASYFHSPEYGSPYTALISALQALPHVSSSSSSIPSQDEDIEPSPSDAPILFALLDILLPSTSTLASWEQDKLIADATLAIKATHNRADDALDLVSLLRELDEDSLDEGGEGGMGVYHIPSPSLGPASHSISPAQSTNRGAKQELPSMPPPFPPPTSRSSSIQTHTKNKPSPYQWQSVPVRKTHSTSPNPLAAYIPSYAVDVNGIPSNISRKRGKGIGPATQVHSTKAAIGQDYFRRRDELLREATRMWQKGNKKSRGGEVAWYFAERAREFQELAKKEQLNAARATVESKRLASANHDTVDLHGLTVSEGVAVVKETLNELGCSSSKSLKIITGRGTHSANQVSVLKPAVRKALVEDGWSVGAWDGGLVVRGKR